MSSETLASESDRLHGALIGLALGDALGKPAESMTRVEIKKCYGCIEDFIDPVEGHPISHGLKAAQVTDDTEQAILLARRIIASPEFFDSVGWANDLLEWETEIKHRGLYDILGPSTKTALTLIAKGVPPKDAARQGTTNGAAMRITPVGLVAKPKGVVRFVDSIEAVSCVTHNTNVAISGAAAVAAMISASVSGAGFEESLEFTFDVLEEGSTRGNQVENQNISDRIRQALGFAEQNRSVNEIADSIGTSVESVESIPMAFGILRLSGGDVWRAAKLAANIGGDTDTIGAMACAMAGATAGLGSIQQDKVEVLMNANQIDFFDIAEKLLVIRENSLFLSSGENT